LRYLNLPEAIAWYMERLFPLERRIVEVVGPVAERLVGVPMPTAPVMAQVESLFDDVLALRRLLTDPAATCAQLITTDESVVLRETERALGYLHLHQIPVGRVVVNRARDDTWRELARRFSPVAVIPMGTHVAEPVGVDALTRLADELFGADALPEARDVAPMQVHAASDGARIEFRLPRPENPREFKVGRRGDDLIIDWGPVRRHLPLPPSVARMTLRRAAWSDQGVSLEFAA
jgi:arsenite-transporting ATPase